MSSYLAEQFDVTPIAIQVLLLAQEVNQRQRVTKSGAASDYE